MKRGGSKGRVNVIKGRAESADKLAYIFIYNDEFMMVIFPKMRNEKKEVNLRGGKYHL
jgi:hypothetical protein